MQAPCFDINWHMRRLVFFSENFVKVPKGGGKMWISCKGKTLINLNKTQRVYTNCMLFPLAHSVHYFRSAVPVPALQKHGCDSRSDAVKA